MKGTRRAGDPPQFSHAEQGYSTAPPDTPEVSLLSPSGLPNENAVNLSASNSGMYGQNVSKGADRQNFNRTGGNLNAHGAAQNHHASRVYDSPYGHSDLEYAYHGSLRTPSQLLDPGFSMAPDNNTSFVQANAFASQSPFAMEPMNTAMQPTYQVLPGTNFEAPLHRFSGIAMERAQVQASPVAQGLYSMPSTPDLQYELWANLEPDLFAQEPVPQYNPGDIGMVESFGYEHHHPRPSTLSSSTSWNVTPASCQNPPGPHSNIAADHKTWAILSQALPDVGVDGSSNSAQASIASTSTGNATMHKDRQEYPSRPAQHGVAQYSNQGYPAQPAQHEVVNQGYPARPAQHEVAQNFYQGYPTQPAQHGVAQNPNQGMYTLPVNEYGGTNMMDMVMEDSISDAISSTEDPSGREVAPTQTPPHGYNNVQSYSPDTSVVTESGLQRSSRSQNNVWEPQSYNGDAEENDFTQLMGQGLSGIRQLGEARWAFQLLSLCAEAVASQNIPRTQHLMWVLNDLASVGGDVNQRFAAYGLRALYMRVTNHTEAIKTYVRPCHHDQEITFGPKMVHSALVKFHEHVPWHQNCYSASSQTLLEVCAGKSRLHLIDIGAGKGIEWPIFIDALVNRAGGPPSILRITMIKERRKEEQNVVTAKSVNSEAADFMTRLVKFASGLGLHVEVNVVGKALECVTREDLRLRHGEILAVVCQFRLHRLSDEVPERSSNSPPVPSKPLLSPRDEFIDFLFQLNPHVFIMSDNATNHCPVEFLPRFQNVIAFWWSFFESIDTGYAGRDSQGREIIEYEAGSMLLNGVACEGRARIERNEPYARWSRRIRRAGFVPKVLSDDAKKVCQNLVINHGSFWDVAFDDSNCVLLRWRKEPMTFTSVWATPDHCSKNSCKCSMLHN